MINKKIHILLVEDDLNLGYVIKDNLSLQGYEVEHALDGEKGWQAFSKRKFQLCILDIMLPKKDGFSLAKQIRNVNKEIPILFLTAKSMKEDKIQGFNSGGDDYITKPFSIEELLLRINVFLKRSSVYETPRTGEIITVGNTTFDYQNLTLNSNGNSQTLTQKEADLFYFFATSPNIVINRGDILKKIWGEDNYFLGRSLDVFISRLRKYLKKDPSLEITNLHGVGFKLNVK